MPAKPQGLAAACPHALTARPRETEGSRGAWRRETKVCPESARHVRPSTRARHRRRQRLSAKGLARAFCAALLSPPYVVRRYRTLEPFAITAQGPSRRTLAHAPACALLRP